MHTRLLIALCLLAATFSPGMAGENSTAQLVGTVLEGRNRWNPFDPGSDMQADGKGGFTRTVHLSAAGGRNRDGVYAMRFFLGRDLRSVYKRGAEMGKLVTGPGSASGGNVVFRVPSDGEYAVAFNPASASYAISPAVEELTKIESFQVNGFVHDREGSAECFDGFRTRPAEKWDEWVPSHDLARQKDGSWTVKLPLSAAGGHERNGVYQCLFSANHNSDWGYGAIVGEPGRLAGGNGYDSRVGHVEETAVVFRVAKDGDYTLTAWPDEYRFAVSPPVQLFQKLDLQVDGDVVPDPWNPAAPSHDMVKGGDGLWRKTLNLSTTGGSNGQGVYTMNFSIDGDWAFDGVGFGGVWGKTWHSPPQALNLLFRVVKDGEYRVTLDPARGTFAFDPPVAPFTRVESLQISGNFECFAGDGKEGWNPLDPSHDMSTSDGVVFTKELRLSQRVIYTYKYTANRAGWAWSLVDYPYDGYRRLSPHGNPPPLTFECPRDGVYRFTADIRTGDYSVVLVRHL